MATQRSHQMKHHFRLLAFLAFICLVAGLTRRVFPRPSSNAPPLRTGHQPNSELNRIYGRWEAVRASLGLPPLHHIIPAPPIVSEIAPPHSPGKLASRFDLRRKREEQASRHYPPLHFAPDTQHHQAAQSVEDIAAVFRHLATLEGRPKSGTGDA
ncbi:hypothetical protein BS17DRAFT_877340 [Gyrodon lividus]|nr:hypothetical protein BS17DRAFT_877340 [Gyrodon lividus]